MPPPCDVDPAGRGPQAGSYPSPSSVHRVGSAAAAVPAAATTFSFTVPAHVTAAWLTRARIREWLEALRFPADWVDDVEYVVSEAVSNAAEHAYPAGTTDGSIVVEAQAFVAPEDRSHGEQLWRVRVRVEDTGRWRPVNPDRQHRGHGLVAIAALAAEVTIRHGEDASSKGTEVVVLSQPAPRGAGSDRAHQGPLAL